MSPGQMPINLVQGVPWHHRLTFMQPQWNYRPITAILPTAPLKITVPGHGLPDDSWPVWIEGSTSSALNADRKRQMYRIASVLADDTLEFNDINGSAIRAQGGQLAYQSALDFAGCAARLIFYKGDEPLITLETGSGLTFGPGSISIELTAEQVADAGAACRYDLIVTHSDDRDIKWVCGPVAISTCAPETAGAACGSVIQSTTTSTVVISQCGQGPAGRNGVDGATISTDADNQIENRPNGLYVKPTSWAKKEW